MNHHIYWYWSLSLSAAFCTDMMGWSETLSYLTIIFNNHIELEVSAFWQAPSVEKFGGILPTQLYIKIISMKSCLVNGAKMKWKGAIWWWQRNSNVERNECEDEPVKCLHNNKDIAAILCCTGGLMVFLWRHLASS